jgi:hypothetical protein
MNDLAITVVDTIPIRPHAGKVTDALSRIGYTIQEAVADLLDNSLDAGASEALVRFVHDGSELRRILIADNGDGMDREELLKAMQFGSDRIRRPKDLGKFGMGLKTAALSQGRSLTVISKKRAQVSAYRWTTQTIAAGWNCEVLDPEKAATWLMSLRLPFVIGVSGTLVAIDELDHVRTGAKGLESTLQSLQKKLSVHLGLTFHRFIDEGTRLHVDAAPISAEDAGFGVIVESLNPFHYPISGDPQYPLPFTLSGPKLPAIECVAHVWPPNQTSSGYFLGGSNVSKRQGFYFYRNDRLIQAGGWNGWRENDNEHHLSLARVVLELGPECDATFRLNVQKSGLDVPEVFRVALDAKVSPMSRFVKRAEDVYRKKTVIEQEFVPVPGRGFGGAVRRRSAAYLAGVKAPRREINVLWMNLAADRFFDIDRDAGNIILNSQYRAAILCGARSSLNDAPVIKILVFLVLRDDLLRERESKRFTERLEEINELLMLAIREVD